MSGPDRNEVLIGQALRLFIAHQLQVADDPQAQADAEDAAVILFLHEFKQADLTVDLTCLS
jgi:hypothetical protein